MLYNLYSKLPGIKKGDKKRFFRILRVFLTLNPHNFQESLDK